ncbi:MAG TPA: hypothetical protein VM032_06125 [Vicinamibacterales bacterium]|nr:hypothetical protein [Vicinamibacterales bacterium]
MSGFSAEWLALREPADAAARAPAVHRFVLDALATVRPMRIVDLGSGAGSNVRYLSSRIRQPQEWHLVDHDARLLAHARALLPMPCATHVADLGRLDPGLLAGCTLVTASALLDLVSEGWLASFVQLCRQAHAAVLVALNYDGRIHCSPADEDDEFVRDRVNRHQRTDKGFGPALGPDAGAFAEARLRGAGYDVVRERSDWILDAARAELQRQLIAGWADAAIELEPPAVARITAWKTRRLAHVDAGRSGIVVGHDDVGAVNPRGEVR